MPKTKGTPLTLEVFEQVIMPRIENFFNEKTEIFQEEVGKYREEVLGFKQEVLGEIDKLRDDSAVSTHQYKRILDRIEVVEKRLEITPAD